MKKITLTEEQFSLLLKEAGEFIGDSPSSMDEYTNDIETTELTTSPDGDSLEKKKGPEADDVARNISKQAFWFNNSTNRCI